MRPLLCRLSYRAILHPLSIPVRAFALAAPQRASLPSEAPFLTASFAQLDFHVYSMHQKCTPLISFSGFTATGSKDGDAGAGESVGQVCLHPALCGAKNIPLIRQAIARIMQLWEFYRFLGVEA
jgi:hypothetical protein